MFLLLSGALVAGMAISAQAGPVSDALKAYYDFEVFDQTGGSNPAGFPQESGSNANEGKYADMSGNGNDAYASPVGSAHFLPQSNSGRFGNAFYSVDGGNVGSMAVAAHSGGLNADAGESFTVSTWEKVGFRTTDPSTWKPGQGRSPVWSKVDDRTVVGNNGLSLQYSVSRIRYNSNNDPYVQANLVQANHANWDNNQWAHFVTVGTYNAGSDDVTLKTFINGQHFAGLDVTVQDELIDNNGYFSLGGIWRSDGGALGWPHQRFLSWNTTEGFIDDFARLDDLALTDGEAMATYNLAQKAELDYDMGTVVSLLDVHRDGTGSVDVGDLTWSFATSGFTGGEGVVTGGGTDFALLLDGQRGTGLIGAAEVVIPEPSTFAIWALGLVGVFAWRRRKR
jgi:hypothetical protein